MANVKISDIATTTAAVTPTHLFESETGAGGSEKTPARIARAFMSSERARDVPAKASFTQRLGSGAIDDVTHGVRLRAPGTATNTNSLIYCVQAIAAGAAGWRATARFRRHFPLVNWAMAGLILRDGAGGSSRLYSIGRDSVHGFNRNTFTNDTSWASVTAMVEAWGFEDFWMRVYDDLTNHTISISKDGEYWQRVYQEARGTFNTPTQVGFHLNPNAGGTTTGVANIRSEIAFDCLSWTFESLP